MKYPLYTLGKQYNLDMGVLNLLEKLDKRYGEEFRTSPAALKVEFGKYKVW